MADDLATKVKKLETELSALIHWTECLQALATQHNHAIRELTIRAEGKSDVHPAP